MRPPLLLSFDVEDWHQLVHRQLGVPGWDAARPEFGRQMRAVFALLDELEASATFFLLGMTAARYPDVVREIAERGYEVASHGYAHARVYRQARHEFRADVERSVELIESLAGRPPRGYRAPAFSINRTTPWAYDVLAELGFRYDSSQYDSPRIPARIRPVPETPYRLQLASGRELWELPIAAWRRGRRTLPIGGGAYWRVLPAAVLRRAFTELGRRGALPVLYFHPYECDPEPLRATLPPNAPPRQRARAVLRGFRRNPGRGLVVARLRAIARHFRLVSYEEAYGEIVERYGSSRRALSPEGVLV